MIHNSLDKQEDSKQASKKGGPVIVNCIKSRPRFEREKLSPIFGLVVDEREFRNPPSVKQSQRRSSTSQAVF